MSPGGPRGQMTSVSSAAVGSSFVLAWAVSVGLWSTLVLLSEQKESVDLSRQ